MNSFGAEKTTDPMLLLARILLASLFIVAGYGKSLNLAGTTGYMGNLGLPAPEAMAYIAIVVELAGGAAILLGVYTRPVALFLAIYTFVTALAGHHFWTMTGPAHAANVTQFYKNLSITGGFVALYITGAGRYAIDRALKLA